MIMDPDLLNGVYMLAGVYVGIMIEYYVQKHITKSHRRRVR